MKRSRGSITIFGCLTILLVSEVLYAFLEAGRLHALQCCENVEAKAVIESVYASYQNPLWENFAILGYDNTAVDPSGMGYVIHEKGLQAKANLLTSSLTGCETVNWQLLTDGDGEVFRQSVVSYMKRNWPYELLQSYLEEEAEMEDLEIGDSTSFSGYLEPLKEMMHCLDVFDLSSSGGGGKQITGQSGEEETTLSDFLWIPSVEAILSLETGGLTQWVIADSQTVSKNSIADKELVSNRTLQTGTMPIDSSMSIIDPVWYFAYIYSHYGFYSEEMENHAMAYELEYLIQGSKKDSMNLEGVLYRLLCLRMAGNIVSICDDDAKMATLRTMAALVAAAIMQPELEETFTDAFVVAWASVESILDLRAMVKGDRIAIVKTDEEWTTQLSLLQNYLFINVSSNPCEHGLTYEQCVKAMVCMTAPNTLAYRAMDLQEVTIQNISGYEDFRMDHVVTASEMEFTYEQKPVFCRWIHLVSFENKNRNYQVQESYSYIK